ncbi:hypothetical protein TNIN_215371 [Trichonephila inaurata madagascariensis]|uniref:Uncharacterized protein n=1 Tax=Trichonephila inaurata madagascariensis TaxID=2747483 RepID=A0A8X6JJK3_9ARAC|nr:hypothetical protein TNIN_215371 [Trichonephila inaurata madagascariensis]
MSGMPQAQCFASPNKYEQDALSGRPRTSLTSFVIDDSTRCQSVLGDWGVSWRGWVGRRMPTEGVEFYTASLECCNLVAVDQCVID